MIKPATIARLQSALGLAFLLSFVFFSIWARFPIPYRDDWDWLLWILNRPLSFRTLFEPHNEHLIPLPRLLAALQYRFFGSDTRVVFAVALIAQLAVSWLMWLEIRRRWREDQVTAAFVFGMVSVCLFFSHQLQSFVFMAAVLFPLVQAFAILSVVCLLHASEPRERRPTAWIIAATLAAIGAALTTTNGFLVPGILAMLAWSRGGSRRRVAGFVAAMAIGAGVYALLAGRPWLHPPLPAGTAWTVPSIGPMVAFFLAFFSSPLAYGSIRAAVVLGAVMFGLGCYSVWNGAARRTSAPRIEHFAIAVMVFATLSAAMATPARAQFGAIQAAQSRYATYSMAYAAALVLWGMSRLESWHGWARMRTSAMVSTIVATAILLPAHLFIGAVWKAKADNMAVVGLALAANVDDDEWIATLHPITSIVHDAGQRLRSVSDPLVVDPIIGAHSDALPDAATCAGTIELLNLGRTVGWRASGTLVTPASQAVIVDRSGIVKGLVRRAPLVELPNPMEPQVVAAVWSSIQRRSATGERWVGFVQRGDGGPYRLVGIGEDRTVLCQSAVTQAEPIRVFLDAPSGAVTNAAAGSGWAVQCGGVVDHIAVLVDGIEQTLSHLERHVPRPDVRTYFAADCDVGNDGGFSFSFDTRALPTGTHQLKVTARNRTGQTRDSNTLPIAVSHP